MTRAQTDLDELVEHWTLVKDEQALVAGKRGATRLGFIVLWKFSTQNGRFPRGRFELSGEAVEFVARQVRLELLARCRTESIERVVAPAAGADQDDDGSAIAYGKGGEIASNRRDEQEGADPLAPFDRRGPTPLFWSRVRPYGEVNLDMYSRLGLASATVPGPRAATPAPRVV
ncbi:DUF4158 domain-containing protein [Streptomyces sp. 4F14]|uniref:DUF4158 domain-containing protein n=1 Tax=Streptomyces sp. 4F14 TaxID=3394380 RepID=UPI003A84175B